MSYTQKIQRNNTLLLVLGLLGLCLVMFVTAASMYTAWLLAGLLVSGTLHQVFVMFGILGLAASTAHVHG